jgi:hypothetical protein
MSQVILSGLIWAFSFWMVADCLRRRASPWWVIVILLIQPYGGLAYLIFLKIRERRTEQRGPLQSTTGGLAAIAPATAHGGAALGLGLDVADQLEEQRRFAEAAVIYQRSLALDDRDPRALHGLARCRVELGQPREALESYEALMAVEPRYRNYAAALEYAETLHLAGRDLDATGLLEGLVEETGRLNHRLALAHYHEAAGQTARARTVLEQALEAYASSPPHDREANRKWQRRIAEKLEELTAH